METRYISMKEAIDTAKFYEAECDPIPRLIDSLNAIPAAAVVEKTEWDKLMFLVDAANQILEAAKWISVKKKLPEIGKNVLVCFQNGDMTVAYVFDTNEDRALWRAITDEGWTGDCDAEPTHWMPLPEPPKEGASK